MTKRFAVLCATLGALISAPTRADDLGGAIPMENTFYQPSENAQTSNANVSYSGSTPSSSAPFSTQTTNLSAVDPNNAFGTAPGTRYGMFYLIWHCLAGTNNYNTYTNPAPVLQYNWHSTPAVGYYCPLDRPDILRLHAEQLRDAGIDFAFIDLTNFDGTEGEAANIGALAPFEALVREWSQVKGAPKIVPWMPFRNGGVINAFVDNTFENYKNATGIDMRFEFRGKPLMLELRDAIHDSDQNLVNAYRQKYTVRTEWIMSPNPNDWDFIRPCQAGFRENGINGIFIPCKQSVGLGPDGILEMIPVVTAYQSTCMSYLPTATPKFDGATFHQQIQRMDDFQDPPLVLIDGWNEWIAVRYCQIGLMPTADCTNGSPVFPDGRPVFVDQYDDNYNRDLEPSTMDGGRYYGQLVGEVLGRKKDRSVMIGYVDSVLPNGDGSGTVNGWACSTGYRDAIRVEVYADGGSGVGELVTSGVADASNEEAVGLVCQDGNVANHRFHLPVTAAQMQRYANQTVYARGISPVGKPSYLLGNSGQLGFDNRQTGTGVTQPQGGTSGGMTPVYRFRSAVTGQHFFTASYREGANAGYDYEGQAFSLLPANTSGAVNVYRCNANGNFLSNDPNCEGATVEGVMGSLWATAGDGRQPLWRLYNSTNRDHLQTVNDVERMVSGYQTDGPLGFVGH